MKTFASVGLCLGLRAGADFLGNENEVRQRASPWPETEISRALTADSLNLYKMEGFLSYDETEQLTSMLRSLWKTHERINEKQGMVSMDRYPTERDSIVSLCSPSRICRCLHIGKHDLMGPHCLHQSPAGQERLIETEHASCTQCEKQRCFPY
eukprot:TRINITY_DN20997_c0_g1_i2.p1 TRINITY_DN20997_c0_g1~~TRINITY_DN20997_c0_g1_i2.p1  ORF type:complete len:153 (-),score=1.37 TRINITY_DN20997_c0_g1_i2:37-495(-)